VTKVIITGSFDGILPLTKSKDCKPKKNSASAPKKKLGPKSEGSRHLKIPTSEQVKAEYKKLLARPGVNPSS
jgi:hypothetical protein